MESPKNFDFRAAEQHWYQHWLDQKYFESTPDDITWMSENAPKLGYSVIHGSVLKKMWEKGLVS